MMQLRLAMVQMNAVVGDLEENTRAICQWIRDARKAKAEVVVFPELAVSGYPPEDLLLMPQYLRDIRRMRDRVARATKGIMAVVGSVAEPSEVKEKHQLRVGSREEEKKPLNVAWVFANGRVQGLYAKHKLPNYGVFDEQRYFQPGTTSPVFCLGSVRIGVNICEDIWFADGPTRTQVLCGGAHLILNVNASPYHVGKTQTRQRLLAARAKENRVIVSYTNMIGGQDELVFDGNSLVLDQRGKVVARAKAFEEDLLLTDLDLSQSDQSIGKGLKKGSFRESEYRVPTIRIPWSPSRSKFMPAHVRKISPSLNQSQEIYRALVLGVTDYVRKNLFSKVLVGISGGIDSALTAAIARDALGASNVVGVMMPSPYTSKESRRDAKALAKNLGINLLNLPITSVFKEFLRLLHNTFQDRPFDTTEENLQARIRGTLLMALSNKFGYLVLTTGNKSEMSVGYATLYGDMAGGFAVIKDVPKTKVYQVARWRSGYADSHLDHLDIPQGIQERAPSAELKPDQTDQDTLPPYPMLDAILQAYVEDNCSKNAMIKMGFAPRVVQKVMRLVDQSEYKRRQSPVGIKITPRALGKDRRMPITNRYPTGT